MARLEVCRTSSEGFDAHVEEKELSWKEKERNPRENLSVEKVIAHSFLCLYVFLDEFFVLFGLGIATLVQFKYGRQSILCVMEIYVELPDVHLEEYRQHENEGRLYVVPHFHRFLPRFEFHDVDFVPLVKIENVTFELLVNFIP